MKLDWQESFKEIEIKIRKEEGHKKEKAFSVNSPGVVSTLFEKKESKNQNEKESERQEEEEKEEVDSSEEEWSTQEKIKEHILITEEYIKVDYKKKTVHIDLLDQIKTNKKDVHINSDQNVITIRLKKKEPKLWGHLHLFSLFIRYRNKQYPNLIKCTPEEKKKLWEEEKIFKQIINLRRIRSVQKHKEKINSEQKHQKEFLNKLENEAQQIQWEAEQGKNEQLKILKEETKKKAEASIYEMNEEVSEKNDECCNNIVNEEQMEENASFLNNNEKPKRIQLKFTQLKRNEIPARESRMIKKTSTNYTSTKNFFLIVLMEKAKKFFFKNSDFRSCLEALKSVDECASTGLNLNREEYFKVLNNLSLLYLLTNCLHESIAYCDKLIQVINEEMKNYSVDYLNSYDVCILQSESPNMITSSFLEKVKVQSYIQYLNTIYAIALMRKMFASIKLGDFQNKEWAYNSLETIKKFIPNELYEHIKNNLERLKMIEQIKKGLEAPVSNVKEIKSCLSHLKEDAYEKNRKDNPEVFFTFSFVIKRSFCLKNLNEFYRNIINLFLGFYYTVENQFILYRVLSNTKGMCLSYFCINVYFFILLVKGDSSFFEKILLIKQSAEMGTGFEIEIQQRIVKALTQEVFDECNDDVDFALKHNQILNHIIVLLQEKKEDTKKIVYEPELKMIKNEKGEEINNEIIINKNVIYKIKYKKNQRIRNIQTVNEIDTDNVKVNFFFNEEEYRKINDTCERFKVDLTFKIIKSVCYICSLIQKIYKDNTKEKKVFRNIIYYFLIELAYSMKHLNNSLFKVENFISIIYLYFCFSFIYNFDDNEFFIQTKETHVPSSNTNQNTLSIKNEEHEQEKTPDDYSEKMENQKTIKQYVRQVMNQTFLKHFYADFTKFKQTKKTEVSRKIMHIFQKTENSNEIKKEVPKGKETQRMMQCIVFLIKQIKGDNKELEPVLLNNRNIEELIEWISLLSKKHHYLKCIQYCMLLVSFYIKKNSTHKISNTVIYMVKQIFNLEFFTKERLVSEVHLKNTTLTNQEKLKKWIAYFTNSVSINITNEKRHIFLNSLKEENKKREKTFNRFVKTLIRKCIKIELINMIECCLIGLKATNGIINNFRTYVTNFMEDILMDFYVFNCVVSCTSTDVSFYFLRKTMKKDDAKGLTIEDFTYLPLKSPSNINEYKETIIHYCKKFLKFKIKYLSKRNPF